MRITLLYGNDADPAAVREDAGQVRDVLGLGVGSAAVSDQQINLVDVRAAATFDSIAEGRASMVVTQDILLALVEAVEADHALEVVEAKGLSLDPAEHREAIARHDNALARFDFGPRP